MERKGDVAINIILLGEAGVGKTSLMTRFGTGIFKQTSSTLMVDYYFAQLEVLGRCVDLHFWDSGGQENFRSIVRQYFRLANGVLLVYDVTDLTTFQKLSGWLLDLKSINEDAVSVIVGSKTDLASNRAVSVSVVKSFAQVENMKYFECSAKTGENIQSILEALTLEVLIAKKIISLPEANCSSSSPDEANCSSSPDEANCSSSSPDEAPKVDEQTEPEENANATNTNLNNAEWVYVNNTDEIPTIKLTKKGTISSAVRKKKKCC